jgi:hypothetical protein
MTESSDCFLIKKSQENAGIPILSDNGYFVYFQMAESQTNLVWKHFRKGREIV